MKKIARFVEMVAGAEPSFDLSDENDIDIDMLSDATLSMVYYFVFPNENPNRSMNTRDRSQKQNMNDGMTGEKLQCDPNLCEKISSLFEEGVVNVIALQYLFVGKRPSMQPMRLNRAIKNFDFGENSREIVGISNKINSIGNQRNDANDVVTVEISKDGQKVDLFFTQSSFGQLMNTLAGKLQMQTKMHENQAIVAAIKSNELVSVKISTNGQKIDFSFTREMWLAVCDTVQSIFGPVKMNTNALLNTFTGELPIRMQSMYENRAIGRLNTENHLQAIANIPDSIQYNENQQNYQTDEEYEEDEDEHENDSSSTSLPSIADADLDAALYQLYHKNA